MTTAISDAIAPLTGQVPEEQILVKARAVTKRFGGLVAVNQVDFDIPRGSIVSLIGPNGAGKTTFFNMITGAYTPTSAEISFDGHALVTTKGSKVKALKPHEVTALGIGRTFQNIRLFGTMSALDNVLVGQHVHLRSRWWDAVLRKRSAWPAPTSCSISWAWATGPMPGRATCPTAISDAWRSPAPSPPAPSCSCSTSPRPA
jgi:hypothetical protein